jgi:hypothetical protein
MTHRLKFQIKTTWPDRERKRDGREKVEERRGEEKRKGGGKALVSACR